MRALVHDHPGATTDLHISTADIPNPGPGEVRIRVHAAGLNPVDGKLLGANNPAWAWPHIPGLDFAGTVDALGLGVTGLAVGQAVAGHGAINSEGSFAEYTLAKALTVAPIPTGVSFAQAAALPCAALTAYQSILRMHLHPGHTLLVRAAGGAVGGFAVQLAARTGACVIATASEHDHERVRLLGATHIVDHYLENVADRVRELTNSRGVDAVIDSLEGTATESLQMLGFNGQLAYIGSKPDLDSLAQFTTAPTVHEIALGAAHTSRDLRALRWLSTGLVGLMNLVATGELDPMISRLVTLEEVPGALAEVLAGKAHGKVIAEI